MSDPRDTTSPPRYGQVWQFSDGDVSIVRTILGVDFDGAVLTQQQVAYDNDSGPYNSTERCPINQWGEWMRRFALVREEPRQ